MYSFFCTQYHSVKKTLNPYVITMLGTDTNYKPSIEQKFKFMKVNGGNNPIPYTELLGFMSERMTTNHQVLQNRRYNPFEVVTSSQLENTRFRLDSGAVTIINGPDTIGHKVNHRIAMGVHEALRALYNGYDEINLIAHSRGAVESILIAHEIERIQQTIDDANMDVQVFKDNYLKSPQPVINQCLEKLLHDDVANIVDTEYVSFLENLKSLRLNIFAIDPVPGGEYETLGLNQVWWHDHERYLKIPSIVKNYTQLLLENDHSVGFRTIIPLYNRETTNFNVINLLGAHGTASGNPRKHDGTPPIHDENEIRDCQYIAMAHLVDFLEKNEVQFQACDEEEIFLAPEFNRYINPENPRDNIRLEYYQSMIGNIASYQALQKTSYTGVCENVISRATGQSNVNRYLYRLEENAPSSPKSIQVYFPDYIVPDRKIVNFEHALALFGLPNLNHEDNLDEIDTLQVLKNIINASIDAKEVQTKVKALQIQDCLQTFEWVIQQVKFHIYNTDKLFNFAFLKAFFMEILSRESNTLNPLEVFLLHKTFTLHMAMQECQLADENGYDELKDLMIKLNRGYSKLSFDWVDGAEEYSDENLDEIRVQYLNALKSKENKIESEHVKMVPGQGMLSYTHLSVVSMVGASALVPLLFCPVVNALPILISISVLLACSFVLFLMDAYQPEVARPCMG